MALPAILHLLRQQPDVEIVPATSGLFRRGCEFRAPRADKEWSVTGCISFLAMQKRASPD